MMIYVDGDACPVKEEVVRVAQRHGLLVHMVSNQAMRLPSSPLVRLQVVAGGWDKADDWIVQQVQAGDLVITADIPLAARCVAKQAGVLSPKGKPFDEEGIGLALALRNLNSQLRESGLLTGGSGPFQAKDRSRFLQGLEEMIQLLKRGRTV